MENCLETLRKELVRYSEETLTNTISKADFDQWLFMDAGTAFGYAYNTRIMNAFPYFNYQSKKSGFEYGKLCVYEIQLHVRNNSSFTLTSILDHVNNHIVRIIEELKTFTELTEPKIEEYSYFGI